MYGNQITNKYKYMKTTTKLILAKKISKLIAEKKINKATKVYGWLLDVMNGNPIIRPVYTQGRTWRYSTLFDKTREMTDLLDMLKLDYIVGNDAPRCGQTGVLICVTTKLK